MLPILRGLAFDRLAALPYAALPIGTAISLLGGWPLIYPRKEAKAYGTKAEIEGDCTCRGSGRGDRRPGDHRRQQVRSHREADRRRAAWCKMWSC